MFSLNERMKWRVSLVLMSIVIILYVYYYINNNAYCIQLQLRKWCHWIYKIQSLLGLYKIVLLLTNNVHVNYYYY